MLRAGFAGGLRPSLTAAPRGADWLSGRDEETELSRTRKHHSACQSWILRNLTHTTARLASFDGLWPLIVLALMGKKIKSRAYIAAEVAA
jgi:hypothetical protein